MMVAIPFLEGIEHEPLKVPVQKPDFRDVFVAY